MNEKIRLDYGLEEGNTESWFVMGDCSKFLHFVFFLTISDSLYHLLMDLSQSRVSCSPDVLEFETLAALACSCLLSLVVARGDTGKLLTAVAAMLMFSSKLATQAIKVMLFEVFKLHLCESFSIWLSRDSWFYIVKCSIDSLELTLKGSKGMNCWWFHFLAMTFEGQRPVLHLSIWFSYQ